MFYLTGVLALASSALAVPALTGACQPSASISFANPPVAAAGLTAKLIYQNLSEPRGMVWDGKDNLLVIERNVGITALTSHNDSTCQGWVKRVVLQQADLEHGIEIGPGKGGKQYLYASSEEKVYRWNYDPQSATVSGNSTTIAWNMTNLNPDGINHVTRTLLLEPRTNSIIVTRGSAGNFDPLSAIVDEGRAQIRRFSLDTIPTATGWAWNQGELLAWGVRNAVAIAFSKDGKDLWEVENSMDELHYQGMDVHEDNPAEELNRIPLTGGSSRPVAQKFYGYPSCFTAWNSAAVPANTTGPQFKFETGAQFSMNTPPMQPDNTWCANPKNNVKPVLSMQAHSAPLDIKFYDTDKCLPKNSPYALNSKWNGDAFVTFHGSWNRDPPAGYSVVRVPWAKNGPAAPASSKTGYETIVTVPDLTRCPENCIRPVSLLFDKKGSLFVSSDDSGEIFVLQTSNTPGY